MGAEYITTVIHKYLQGESLSGEEQLALGQWLDQAKINRRVLEQLQDESHLKVYLKQRMDQEGVEQAFDIFKNTVSAGGRPPVVMGALRRKWLAAAVVFLLAAAAYLLFQHGNNGQQKLANTGAQTPDIAPGRQGAILTLSNGRQVLLDSLGNGLVATQNGTKVTMEEGRLTYAKDQARTAEVLFNTMTTPRGRKFQLLLPDGTKVWLNAASTLTYPTAFTGRERRVSITGEAYFEVAKNAGMPFKVTINDRTEIDVLGTNFNVNAYTDEVSTNTTLLEGSVQVTNSRDKIVLKPGQQASVSSHDPSSSGINVRTAHIEKVMAWKNDLFDFDGATLVEVMNQISRWYDMEIVYEKGVPAFEFGGKIRRDLTLANLLKFLEGAGVHFRIEEGRRLVVMP
jgi:transmembrane sensor